MDKKTFIDAYRAAYGATKKEAEKAYKTAPESWKAAIIDGAKQEAKKAFYND